MKIALYNLVFNEKDIDLFKRIIGRLEANNTDLLLFTPFYEKIKNYIQFSKGPLLFQNTSDLQGQADLLISIGGDGTILQAVTIIKDTKIPIAGINSGRMGFLASISRINVEQAIDALLTGNYLVEDRSLISLTSPINLFSDLNFALNEFSIQKDATPSMIHIHTYVNDVFLNAYWADGLLISTPTGSTGYSLSNGGPIVTPDSANFIITPIATHNLTVRPLIIPDDQQIRIEFRELNKNILLGLDSRSILVQKPINIVLQKANFSVKLVRMTSQTFFETIHQKLMWGLDIRN